MQPSGWYSSGIRIPTAGCWQLTLRTGGWLHRIVVEALPTPGCWLLAARGIGKAAGIVVVRVVSD